jgi:hypothetical protein
MPRREILDRIQKYVDPFRVVPSVTAHSPTGRSALVEVSEAVRTGMTPFARISGFAACSARAVARVVVTSGGGGNCYKCEG